MTGAAEARRQFLERVCSELDLDRGGVPILPGFDELSILDADNGSAGDAEGLGRVLVAELSNPMKAGESAFSNANHWSDDEVRKLRLEVVVEGDEFLRAMDVGRAIVKNAFLVEEFGDDVAIALVPELFEPAKDELLVLFRSRNGLGSGCHGLLREEISAEYI